MTNGKSSQTQSSRSGAGNSTPTKGDPAKISQVKKQLIREKIARQELLEPQRTKFPELKVSKGDGVDKLKQVCNVTPFFTPNYFYKVLTRLSGLGYFLMSFTNRNVYLYDIII